MDDTTKGAGIGAITGAILAIAAKKLASGDKPLSWKDYALWGGVGSAVGGTAGAAIMLPSGAGIGDEQKRELEKEKAEIKKKLDNQPSRLSAGLWTAAKTGGGALAGFWLKNGLINNLVNMLRQRNSNSQSIALQGWAPGKVPLRVRAKALFGALPPIKKGKLVKAKGGKAGGWAGAGLGLLWSLVSGDIGELITPPGSKDRDRLDQINEDLEKLK